MGLRGVMRDLSREELGVKPVPLNITCVDGHNISKVKAAQRNTTIDMEITIRALKITKIRLLMFQNIVSNICKVFTNFGTASLEATSVDFGGGAVFGKKRMFLQRSPRSSFGPYVNPCESRYRPSY